MSGTLDNLFRNVYINADCSAVLFNHMGESFQDYSWIQNFEADFLCQPQNA